MPNYTLLLIDYDPRTLDLLREPLEGMGYTVAIAKDGDEALAAVRDLKPALAFVEVMLPKKPGLDVCKEIKENGATQQTRVVAMTSRFSARRYRHKALREFRADEFIEKPVDPATLHPLLRRLLPGPPPPAPIPAPGAGAAAPSAEKPKDSAPSPEPAPPPVPPAPIPVAPAPPPADPVAPTAVAAPPAADPTPAPAPTPTPAPAPAATPAATATHTPKPAPVATPSASPTPPPSLFGGEGDDAEQEIVDHLDSVLSEKIDDLFGD